VSFWWGDERCVPPDDELSNYGMAQRALLGRAEQLGPVHRMRGELRPADGADAYERELGETAFDLLLLGLGPDGHVASLFPRAPTLEERTRRVVAAEAGFDPFVPRITLTLPAIASAPQVVFLVAGGDKADAARRAFAAAPSRDTPASLARSREGQTVAILDGAAAAELDS
jgi:6-phosphogluconolactonase